MSGISMRSIMHTSLSKFLFRRSFHLSASCRAVIEPEEAEKHFVKPEVQICLRKLVGFDPQIVFQRKPVNKLSSPRYIFMTDGDLKQSLHRVNMRGRKILELVPYKAPYNEDEIDVLSKDPELQGYEKHPIIFTDISPGASDLSRMIAVREPNGLLRRANREERYRMNQAYYPNESRHHVTPQMFSDEYLQPVLDRKEYIFIMNRACVQFEPDDPEFHRVMSRTFDAIDENKEYDVLRSNRYFGSFVFDRVLKDEIDGLVSHLLNNERLEELTLLLKLYYTIRSEKKDQFEKLPSDPIQQLKFYIENSSKLRSKLELCLDAYVEKMNKDSEERASSNS